MSDDVVFIDNYDEVMALLSRATERAAEIIGGFVEDQAGEYAMRAKGPKGNTWPMDILTALRQSITHRVEDTDRGPVLSVGSNMQIAPYIELGTGKHYKPSPEWLEYHGNDKHSVGGLEYWIYHDELEDVDKVGRPMQATPYLRPAFLDHARDIKMIVEDELKNA